MYIVVEYTSTIYVNMPEIPANAELTTESTFANEILIKSIHAGMHNELYTAPDSI